MMNVKGLFKNLINTEEKGTDEPVPSDTVGGTVTEPVDNTTSAGGMGNFFLSGTTKFLDSMQTRKNDLMNDISNKISSFKAPNEQTDLTTKKRRKRNTAGDGDDDGMQSDGSSSASEYGDGGDKPMYAQTAEIERQESVESVDSLPEEEAQIWVTEIRSLVNEILQPNSSCRNQMNKFQTYISRHSGRSKFAKEMKLQTKTLKAVPRETVEQIATFFAPALKQCDAEEDYNPAYLLMNISFRIYHDDVAPNDSAKLVYVFTHVNEQAIWQSMRFWNAAFFIALQKERSQFIPPEGVQGEELMKTEMDFQNDTNYCQLSKFLWRMYALGVNQESCTEFLRKQSSAINLSNDKAKLIYRNLQSFFNSNEQ